MRHWKETVAALAVTLGVLALTLFVAGLLVKIVTALCGADFSWTVAAAVQLALLLAALRLLIRLDAGSGDDPNRKRR